MTLCRRKSENIQKYFGESLRTDQDTSETWELLCFFLFIFEKNGAPWTDDESQRTRESSEAPEGRTG
jgi:hypothetical protein